MQIARLTCILFILISFNLPAVCYSQSVWHLQNKRTVTVTENGVSKTIFLQDHLKDLRTSAIDTCPSNIDFELSNFDQWECLEGKASLVNGANVITNIFSTGPVNNSHMIMSASTTPFYDKYGGFPVVCPAGGSYSVKLGNTSSGAWAHIIRYTFTVPATQPDFSLVYNYAVVFQNPQTAHTTAQQPRFQAKIYDAQTGASINCASYDFFATAGLPVFKLQHVQVVYRRVHQTIRFYIKAGLLYQLIFQALETGLLYWSSQLKIAH